VRDLAQRGVLRGDPGRYVCEEDPADISVPATLQAAIEARIDRLSTPAKRTLNAASVIGLRFGLELLAALGIDAVLVELLAAELIDQVQHTPGPEYAFRHPLIRTVAYESQLRVDRAALHRRVAVAIESGAPAAVDENAALIAEHAEAAGDLHAAYGWHMRAAMWATYRDIAAARRSWERARTIADAVPPDDPERTTASRNCESCVPRPETRRHWPSGWPDWCWSARSGVGSVRRRTLHRKPGLSSSRSAIRR
jgi:predicted ATPase